MMNAYELGISPEEYTSLVLLHDHMVRDAWTVNMGRSVPHEDNVCGSAACLGGNMYMLQEPWDRNTDPWRNYATKMSGYVHHHSHEGMRELFFPYDLDEVLVASGRTRGTFAGGDWQQIPTAVTIKAVENFLNTGRPKWRQAWNDVGPPDISLSD